MFFAFYNGYSGLGFYATTLDTFFNAAWTSWPVLLSTPQDRLIEKETIYANPTVYQHSVASSEFNIRTFSGIAILAICHAAINYFVPAYALDMAAGEHEATPGLWLMSSLSFTCVVITVTVELAIRTVCYFNFTTPVLVLSFVFYFLCLVLLGSATSFAYNVDGVLYGMIEEMLNLPVAYACCIITPCMCATFTALERTVSRWLNPSHVQLVQEMEMQLFKERAGRRGKDTSLRSASQAKDLEVCGQHDLTKRLSNVNQLERRESDYTGYAFSETDSGGGSHAREMVSKRSSAPMSAAATPEPPVGKDEEEGGEPLSETGAI